MANKINVLECGPRDGWQNLKQMLTFEQKLDLIDRLFDAGVTQMEVTSFVSPKAIPQMADAADLAKACIEKYPNAVLYALAPNFRGVENAFNAGIRNISYVISVSESHNKANIRRTHEESLEELQKIMDTYPQMNICVALATSFGCPFEGIPPIQKFQIHIHDTRGMGQANTLAAIECGIKTVQSTLGGLGGCPFAPGASGNTATEDLVYMLQRMGYDTGIDFEKLLAAAKYQKSFIDGIYSGHQQNINTKTPPCC